MITARSVIIMTSVGNGNLVFIIPIITEGITLFFCCFFLIKVSSSPTFAV